MELINSLKKADEKTIRKCKEHPKEALEAFCTTCKKLFCKVGAWSHAHRSFISISDLLKETVTINGKLKKLTDDIQTTNKEMFKMSHLRIESLEVRIAKRIAIYTQNLEKEKLKLAGFRVIPPSLDHLANDTNVDICALVYAKYDDYYFSSKYEQMKVKTRELQNQLANLSDPCYDTRIEISKNDDWKERLPKIVRGWWGKFLAFFKT